MGDSLSYLDNLLMSSRELLCLTVKLQSSKQITTL